MLPAHFDAHFEVLDAFKLGQAVGKRWHNFLVVVYKRYFAIFPPLGKKNLILAVSAVALLGMTLTDRWRKKEKKIAWDENSWGPNGGETSLRSLRRSIPEEERKKRTFFSFPPLLIQIFNYLITECAPNSSSSSSSLFFLSILLPQLPPGWLLDDDASWWLHLMRSKGRMHLQDVSNKNCHILILSN